MPNDSRKDNFSFQIRRMVSLVAEVGASVLNTNGKATRLDQTHTTVSAFISQ